MPILQRSKQEWLDAATPCLRGEPDNVYVASFSGPGLDVDLHKIGSTCCWPVDGRCDNLNTFEFRKANGKRIPLEVRIELAIKGVVAPFAWSANGAQESQEGRRALHLEHAAHRAMPVPPSPKVFSVKGRSKETFEASKSTTFSILSWVMANSFKHSMGQGFVYIFIDTRPVSKMSQRPLVPVEQLGDSGLSSCGGTEEGTDILPANQEHYLEVKRLNEIAERELAVQKMEEEVQKKERAVQKREEELHRREEEVQKREEEVQKHKTLFADVETFPADAQTPPGEPLLSSVANESRSVLEDVEITPAPSKLAAAPEEDQWQELAHLNGVQIFWDGHGHYEQVDPGWLQAVELQETNVSNTENSGPEHAAEGIDRCSFCGRSSHWASVKPCRNHCYQFGVDRGRQCRMCNIQTYDFDLTSDSHYRGCKWVFVGCDNDYAGVQPDSTKSPRKADRHAALKRRCGEMSPCALRDYEMRQTEIRQRWHRERPLRVQRHAAAMNPGCSSGMSPGY